MKNAVRVSYGIFLLRGMIVYMTKRRVFLILYCISFLIAAGVILIGLFAAPLPLWAAGIAMVLPMIAAVGSLIFGKISAASFSLKTAGALLAAGVTFLGTFCDPYWGSYMFYSVPAGLPADTVLRPDQVEADLSTLEEVLSRIHPLFLDGTPEEFQAAMDEARKSLAYQSTLTVNDLRRAAQTAVSSLSDAHTTVYARTEADRYRADYAEMKKAGYEIIAVNGVPYEDFFRENCRLVSYEAESWADEQFEGYLNSESGLTYLGFSTDGFTLTYSNGEEEITKSYTDADFLPYDEYMAKNAAYYEVSESFVSYEIDEEKSLAVLTLEECNFNDEYRRTLREMFTEVKERGIRNVAVDLRGNGGGNSLVANEFIRYLDVEQYRDDGMKWRLGGFLLDFPVSVTENDRISDLTFTGNTYLLTSASSFSSAMLFALYFKDNSLGTIIGETPGNAANGCGDVIRFRLPNSGLLLQCSMKIFTRPSEDSDDLFVEPDIPCSSEEALERLYAALAV